MFVVISVAIVAPRAPAFADRTLMAVAVIAFAECHNVRVASQKIGTRLPANCVDANFVHQERHGWC